MSLFHTIAWCCALINTSCRAALVVGNLSDCACFFLNNHHLASLTWVITVLGTYNWQTKCSRAASVALVGFSFVLRSARAVITSRPASWNVFACLFLLSAPLSAWNPGKVVVLSGPSASTIDRSGVTQRLFPSPLTKAVCSHNSS